MLFVWQRVYFANLGDVCYFLCLVLLSNCIMYYVVLSKGSIILYKLNGEFTFSIFKYCYRVRAMVFNHTFNNISAILWWSILLVEETGVKLDHTTMYRIHLTMSGIRAHNLCVKDNFQKLLTGNSLYGNRNSFVYM
jgi:hypothetical protein